MITPILAIIFNASLQNCIVPRDWKLANITPMFKKGDHAQPCNYRSISLTCIISKVFKHIIVSTIMNHLESNGMLYHLQHGFHQHLSCKTQLLSLFHELVSNNDGGIQTDLVFMDFVKAFDTVPHKRLLHKLHWYGIRSNIYCWLVDFLSEHFQRVVLDGVTSSHIPVSSGVPQGTVLGPILFLIYFNDLFEVVKYSTLRLYANDCIIYHPISNTHDDDKLQQDIDSILLWAHTWQMKFNTFNCCYMHISEATKLKMETQYKLEDTHLTLSNQFKYLGVTLQSDLKWNCHVEEKVAKTNQILAMIRRNVCVASATTRELAYNTLVCPHLEYASVVWSPWQTYHKDAVEEVLAMVCGI